MIMYKMRVTLTENGSILW